MKQLELLKKYLPSIIYTFLGILAIFIVYKLIGRLKSAGANIGDAVSNAAENMEIAEQSGVKAARVGIIRQAAHDVAYELETLKTMGFWEKISHFQDDTTTLGILANAKSLTEMQLLSSFYKNDFTANGSLKADLKNTSLVFSYNSIPFVFGIS